MITDKEIQILKEMHSHGEISESEFERRMEQVRTEEMEARENFMKAIVGNKEIPKNMTEQDAVKYFKDYMDFCEKDGMELPSREPYDLAIAALEKQVPKKPVEDRCTEHIHYKCKCGYIFRTEYADGLRAGCIYRYCPDCGQAITSDRQQS